MVSRYPGAHTCLCCMNTLMTTPDLFQMPPAERAAYYRELAQQLRSRAVHAATQEIRDAYLKIAVEWLDMADRLEAESVKVSITVESDIASLLQQDPA